MPSFTDSFQALFESTIEKQKALAIICRHLARSRWIGQMMDPPASGPDRWSDSGSSVTVRLILNLYILRGNKS